MDSPVVLQYDHPDDSENNVKLTFLKFLSPLLGGEDEGEGG
jgi:hypothetical protein